MTTTVLEKAGLGALVFPEILHDLNQPLTQLRMRLDLLELRGQITEEVAEEFGNNLDQVNAKVRLAQRLLGISLIEQPAEEKITLEKHIQTAFVYVAERAERLKLQLSINNADESQLLLFDSELQVLLINIFYIVLHHARQHSQPKMQVNVSSFEGGFAVDFQFSWSKNDRLAPNWEAVQMWSEQNELKHLQLDSHILEGRLCLRINTNR